MKKLILLFALITALLSGCKKDDEKSFAIDKATISLLAGETAQITPSATGCSFTPENPLIASVSQSGKVTAICVGETKISVTNGNDTKYCEVKVQPKYSMYKEPHLLFGGSKADIKAKESRKLAEEKATNLLFDGENQYILGVTYLFENSKLTGAGCIIPNTHASLLGKFLVERYVFVKADTDKNRLYYISPDQKVVVVMEVATATLSLVAYAPASSTKAEGADVDAIMDALHSQQDEK